MRETTIMIPDGMMSCFDCGMFHDERSGGYVTTNAEREDGTKDSFLTRWVCHHCESDHEEEGA